MQTSTAAVTVREAVPEDLPVVISLDAATSGTAKPDYWREVFVRHVLAPSDDRYFLVAVLDGEVTGFIVGEVRAWEFGSPPCGWVFAINVDPQRRESGIASALFEAMCQRFRDAGIGTVRTMVSRTQRTQLSFFRSQGLTTGPYIELERRID